MTDDPVERYFRALVTDAERYAVEAARPSAVVEETLDRENLPGGRLAGLVGPSLDRVAGRVLSAVASDVVGGVTGAQLEALLDCVAAGGTALSDDAYAAYEADFVSGLDPVLGDINPEAADSFRECFAGGFEVLVAAGSYFAGVEGATFGDRLRAVPRAEARDHLEAAAGYVGLVREAVAAPHAVYVRRDVGGPRPVRVHFRREAVRLLGEVERYVERRTRRDLADARGE
jgi:hypothetical protein